MTTHNLEQGAQRPALAPAFDPITTEIIQNSLGAVADEMFVAMGRTAMSSVIYEVLDFGVAITDADGNLATSGAGVPSFIGMLDPGVKVIIDKFRHQGGIHPGDVFITNDPYGGGVSHLNDVVLMMPIYYQGELLAWAANKGHWVDIGGISPGSINPNARETFQEGLMLPDVRLFARGQPIDPVFDIIKANIRLPDQSMGDLWAGIAALRVGERRLLALADKYGLQAVRHAIAALLDHGELVSRRSMAALPKGRFDAYDFLDDDRRVQVTVEITDTEFIVDLRGNPPQDPGPFNASFMATLVSAKILFRGVTCPDTRVNAGSFRPLRLLCDEGSLFHARRPAANGLFYENKLRSADLIWKALAAHIPDKMTAGHFCSICATIIGSRDPATGASHSFIEPEPGGWGAGRDKDGENAQFSGSHGDTYNCPVEVNEARNGIHVDAYALNDDPGGEGQFRGGKGLRIEYRIVAPEGWVTAAYTRSKYPPWGMAGGRDGSPNYLKIRRGDGREEIYDKVTQLPLAQGDVICIHTANGGGYGDPRHRPLPLLYEDIRNGYVSPAVAEAIYGLPASRQDKDDADAPCC